MSLLATGIGGVVAEAFRIVLPKKALTKLKMIHAYATESEARRA